MDANRMIISALQELSNCLVIEPLFIGDAPGKIAWDRTDPVSYIANCFRRIHSWELDQNRSHNHRPALQASLAISVRQNKK
jgi:hypothetical protein